jgi:flagellar protein FliO/FliZ
MMKRVMLFVFPGICLMVILISLVALQGHGSVEAAVSTDDPQQKATPGLPGLAVRVSLALGFIVLLIVGAVYLLRAFGGRMGIESGGAMKVLERCHLAPKRALYTVRMGGRVVIVGVTESSITRVLELTEEEGGRLYPDAPAASREETSFVSLLRGAASRVPRLRT